MILVRKVINPDIIGAAASTLCFIHCAATPAIFVVKACTATCCAETPLWWRVIDYIFIVISFVAIYFTARNSSKRWLIGALWFSWVILLLTVVAETMKLELLPNGFIYFPALTIIVLHLYNLFYCRCSGDSCSTNICNVNE